MSTVVTNPATSAHRAQIVAEAVVSAYINEIAPARRERVRARRGCSEAPRAIARPGPAARAPIGRLATRRRAALGLAA